MMMNCSRTTLFTGFLDLMTTETAAWQVADEVAANEVDEKVLADDTEVTDPEDGKDDNSLLTEDPWFSGGGVAHPAGRSRHH